VPARRLLSPSPMPTAPARSPHPKSLSHFDLPAKVEVGVAIDAAVLLLVCRLPPKPL